MRSEAQALLDAVLGMLDYYGNTEPERLGKSGIQRIAFAAHDLEVALKSDPSVDVTPSRDAPWAKKDNPDTSHETKEKWSEARLNAFKQAVLYAHLRLGPCCEREVNDFLESESIAVGNRDNTKKRRGELERLFGYIEIDESAGRGPSLDGEPEVASRYRLTPDGEEVARKVNPAELRAKLPVS